MEHTNSPVADYRHLLYGRYGSFWNESLTQDTKRKFHAFVQTCGRMGSAERASEIQEMLAPSDHWRITHPRVLRFTDADVRYIGPSRTQRIGLHRPSAGETTFASDDGELILLEDPQSAALDTEDAEFLFLPGDTVSVPTADDFAARWMLRLSDRDLFPTRIRSVSGKSDLVHGMHFWIQGGYMVFRADPRAYFPEMRYVMLSGFTRATNVMSYPWQVEPLNYGSSALAQYTKSNSSSAVFVQALAQVCNFYLAPQDDTVIAVFKSPTLAGAAYEFSKSGLMHVDYPHQALKVGDAVKRGDIVGSPMVGSFSSGLDDSHWWQNTHISSLQWDNFLPALPFQITIPNAPCRVFATTQTGPDIHAQINLGATDPAELNKFWAATKRSELLTGKFLNNVIGLASLSDVKYVNPMSLFFDQILGQRAIIIQRYNYPAWSDERKRRFQNFVVRARPSHAIVLTLDT